MNVIPRLLRAAAAIVLGAVWAYAVLVGGILFGFAGQRLGWLWMTPLIAAGLLVAALIWGAAHRRTAIGVALTLSLGLGTVFWYISPPTYDRIVATAETVTIPEGWEQVEEDEYVNYCFFEQCPEVNREYAVPGDAARARADLHAGLESDGWKSVAGSGDRFTKGRWEVTVREETGTDRPQVTLSFASSQ